jgi:hypothetical protein
MVSYTDPSGNEMFAMKGGLPVAAQYIVVLPLASDAELGTYDVSANAYGYSGDFRIWEAANTTTFTVSGKNLKDSLDDMLNEMLNELNEVQIALNNSITTLSDILENEHNLTRSEILSRINDTIDALDGFDQSVLDHDADMKVILDALNDLVVNESNMSKQEILSNLGIIVNDVEDLNADVISEASDIKTELGTAISDVDSDLAAHDGELATHDGELASHDDNLDAQMQVAKEERETLAMYSTIALVLLIIALVFLLISLMLVNKGYKMMKGAKNRKEELPPERMSYKEEPPQEEIIEEDQEIEGAIDDALEDIEPMDSEEL